MQTLNFHRQEVLSHYSHISTVYRLKGQIKYKLEGVVNLENMIFRNIN